MIIDPSHPNYESVRNITDPKYKFLNLTETKDRSDMEIFFSFIEMTKNIDRLVKRNFWFFAPLKSRQLDLERDS